MSYSGKELRALDALRLTLEQEVDKRKISPHEAKVILYLMGWRPPRSRWEELKWTIMRWF